MGSHYFSVFSRFLFISVKILERKCNFFCGTPYVCMFVCQTIAKEEKNDRVTHKFNIFSFDFAQRMLRIDKTNTPTKIFVI